MFLRGRNKEKLFNYLNNYGSLLDLIIPIDYAYMVVGLDYMYSIKNLD